MIQKEAAMAKYEECLGDLPKFVAAFDLNFDRRTRAKFPSC